MKTEDTFRIYIDRLQNEETQSISEEVDSSFMDVAEKNLSFEGKIPVSGEAYLTQDHLVLNLNIQASALLCCIVCNENFSFPVKVEKFLLTKDLSEIKGGIYSYGEDLRSALLLKIPQFAECAEGTCKRRKDLDPYLKKSTPETHTPFSGLDL